jgi:tRNA(Ile)-lysidine synthase
MDDVSQLARRVADSLARHGCLEGVDRVLVGFSGGADSTALLLLLRELGIPLVAHHIHHGLRGDEADADATWCEDFCATRDIPFQLHRLDVMAQQRSRESIEPAARRCRLQLWCQLCRPGDAVALGHHADDAVEDLLLRLARGANASGLTGLRPVRTIHGVRFVRPLLELTRDELRDYLQSLDIDDWREDHTNADPVHRRNAVRHRLLPAFRRVFDGDAGLHRALAALQDDADYLEAQARQALRPQFSLVDWRELPPALLPRVLRLWLARETGADALLRHTDIARLRQALDLRPSHPVEIPLASGPILVLDPAGLRLRELSPALPERHWHWQETPHLALPEIGAELVVSPSPDVPGETFSRAQLPAVLTIRSRKPGDRLIPFGKHSPKKLQDLFTDARIPRDQRDSFPVVLAGATIIWVPGLRRAEFGRVTPNEPSVRLALRAAPSS